MKINAIKLNTIYNKTPFRSNNNNNGETSSLATPKLTSDVTQFSHISNVGESKAAKNASTKALKRVLNYFKPDGITAKGFSEDDLNQLIAERLYLL